MEDNYLLTDEFISFSTKIKSIYEQKKAKKAELKAFYDKVQNELKELDVQAKSVEDEFNKWKAAQKSDE